MTTTKKFISNKMPTTIKAMEMRKLAILLLTTASNFALAGGGPTGGAEYFIIYLAIALFALCALLATWATLKITKSKFIAIGTLTLIIYIPIYLTQQNIEETKRVTEENNEAIKQETIASYQYLEALCKTQESLFISHKIPSNSSFFLSQDLVPLTLLQHVPPAPLEFETYSERSLPSGYHTFQYESFISWMQTVHPGEIIKKLNASSVEYTNHNNETIKYAYKHSWAAENLAHIPLEEFSSHLPEYRFENLKDTELIRELSIPSPNAEYTIKIEDISTLEDRNNWVARGKIIVFNSSNQKIIMEYTGAESMLKPKAVCPMLDPYNSGYRDILTFLSDKILSK